MSDFSPPPIQFMPHQVFKHELELQNVQIPVMQEPPPTLLDALQFADKPTFDTVGDLKTPVFEMADRASDPSFEKLERASDPLFFEKIERASDSLFGSSDKSPWGGRGPGYIASSRGPGIIASSLVVETNGGADAWGGTTIATETLGKRISGGMIKEGIEAVWDGTKWVYWAGKRALGLVGLAITANEVYQWAKNYQPGEPPPSVKTRFDLKENQILYEHPGGYELHYPPPGYDVNGKRMW